MMVRHELIVQTVNEPYRYTGGCCGTTFEVMVDLRDLTKRA